MNLDITTIAQTLITGLEIEIQANKLRAEGIKLLHDALAGELEKLKQPVATTGLVSTEESSGSDEAK